MIRAGGKNRRLSIQRRQAGVDAANQPVDTWDELMRLWAQPRGLSGMGAIREQNGGMPATITRYSWRVKYLPTQITTDMRAVEYVNGVPVAVYSITGLLHDHEKREWTDIVTELGGNNG